MAYLRNAAACPRLLGTYRLIRRVAALGTSSLALLFSCVNAKGQNDPTQFAPEIDTYVHFNESFRVLLLATSVDNEASQQEDFGTYLELALKPIFRRRLRENDDVFKRRFLSFRAGYRYLDTFGDSPSIEHRWIAEMTSRFPLPGSLNVIDHNIGEFRLINNKPLSIRYRNTLQLERDFKVQRLVLTPYVNGELVYDTRYGAWYRDRYAAGVQIPSGKRVLWQTYVMHQNQSHRADPPHLNRIGVTVSFFFGRIQPK